MYFFGLTRFSVYEPGSKAWNISLENEEDYFRRLFDDDRLKDRFNIFFNKALPIYKEMSGCFDYKHIVSYSKFMPEKWSSLLLDLSASYDFVVLNEVSGNGVELPIVKLMDGKPSGPLALFRVDDDDLLSVNYLKNLSIYNKKEYEGMIVSFGQGAIASYRNGEYKRIKYCHRRFLALGMAFIGRYNSKEGKVTLPAGGNHELVDLKSPVILDSRTPMYVWTQHSSQDTKNNRTLDHMLGYESNLFFNYPDIENLEEYVDLFPTLKNEIGNVIAYKTPFFRKSSLSWQGRNIDFDIKSKVGRFFRFDLKSVSNNKLSSLRGALLSVSFNNQVGSVYGLTKSDNEDIGYYKYISFSDGVASLDFEIILDFEVSIESVRLMKWEIRDCEFFLNDFSIFNLG